MFVAFEADFSHFYLRAFMDDEEDADGGGGNGMDFGADGGELAAVFSQQFFDGDFGFLDFGGVVLVFNAEADFAVLEAVEDIAGGDRIQAFVVNAADGGLLFDVDIDDPALGTFLALKADVFKISGIPQSVEIALQGRGIVSIAGLGGRHAGTDTLRGNAAAAINVDVLNDILLGAGRARLDGNRQQGQPYQGLRKTPQHIFRSLGMGRE